MRRFLLALVLMATMVGVQCAAPSLKQATLPVVSIVGSYSVVGANQDGSVYTLQTRITQGEGNLYFVDYFLDGLPVVVGFGILTNTVLSVVFQSTDGVIGLSSLQVTEGKLVGEWLIPLVDGKGAEVLTPIEAIKEPVTDPHIQPVDITPGTIKV